jgi:gamma-glutamyl:cysteine ligase YbdK (ATP-grasp superfamily)
MTTGTEHEYSINDPLFRPLPISDVIISEICGSVESEIPFGEVALAKELQKTVLEFIPNTPSESLFALEEQIYAGVRRFYGQFGGRYRLLGLGMHPTLRLDETRVWDHDEGDYYAVYDRIFALRQHGWMNIQALQVNLSYGNEEELVGMYNRIRVLLPYLIAISASSPFVEGKPTGAVDNRLLYYRKNQEEIPIICNRIIPETIAGVEDYRELLNEMYDELRRRDAGLLCNEWVNSSGIIIRFSRRCLEVKALDEQECVRSDMAVAAFLRALLRSPDSGLETDRDALLEMTEVAIAKGTSALRPELERLLPRARKVATGEEQQYLGIIEDRIVHGSLGELMRDRLRETGDMDEILGSMGDALRNNRPFSGA